jgi:hypothetical protein
MFLQSLLPIAIINVTVTQNTASMLFLIFTFLHNYY